MNLDFENTFRRKHTRLGLSILLIDLIARNVTSFTKFKVNLYAIFVLESEPATGYSQKREKLSFL